MKTINYKIILSVMLYLAITLSGKSQSIDQQDDPNAPEITFEYLVYDYGTIKKASDGKTTFRYKNTGKQPLIIGSVKATCGCTTPSWTKEPIMPGSEGEIVAVYNTNLKGAFSKTIIIHTNAKNTPVVLTIKGKVIE